MAAAVAWSTAGLFTRAMTVDTPTILFWRGAVVASVVALIGVAGMVGVRADGALLGDVLAGLMALCMAGMILLSRRYPAIPALPATCAASLLSALASLPFATLGGVSAHDMGLLGLFGVVNQVLGFGLFALGARLLPPMETALIVALDAPLAPLWVWLVFAETPATATVMGGSLVLVAVFGHILGHSALAKRAA